MSVQSARGELSFSQRPRLQIPDPMPGAIDIGAVSVANGVMYAGSYSAFMYAIEARTGKSLWSFNSGGSVIVHFG